MNIKRVCIKVIRVVILAGMLVLLICYMGIILVNVIMIGGNYA